MAFRGLYLLGITRGTIHDPNRSTIVVLECSPLTPTAMTEDESVSDEHRDFEWTFVNYYAPEASIGLIGKHV